MSSDQEARFQVRTPGRRASLRERRDYGRRRSVSAKRHVCSGATIVMTVRRAVFPVAGLGTRFLPATKAQPKGMLPLVDKPTIQ